MRTVVTISALRLPCMHAASDKSIGFAVAVSAYGFVGCSSLVSRAMAIFAAQLFMDACTKRGCAFMTLKTDLVSRKLT
jgi:putative exporter of polyketide antibiotics